MNRNLLIAVVLLFTGLICFFGYNGHYFQSFFGGARAVDGAQLAKMAGSPSTAANRFIRVQPREVAVTGVEHVTKNDSHPQGFVDSQYLLTNVGGQPLIVRAASGSANRDGAASFEGRLIPIGDELRVLLTDKGDATGGADNQNNRASAESPFLPYYLDTEDYKSFGYMSLIFCVPLLVLACAMLWRYLQGSGDYASSGFARKLAKYGQLEVLVQQIDGETAGAHTTYSKGMNGAELTSRWLIAKTPLAATPMPLDQVVWVYRRLVKRKLYFVITVAKRHSLIVYDRLGQKLVMELKDAQISQILQDIAARAPQAVQGYDKQLTKLWRNTKDKSTFVTAARSQFSNAPLGEQSTTMWNV